MHLGVGGNMVVAHRLGASRRWGRSMAEVPATYGSRRLCVLRACPWCRLWGERAMMNGGTDHPLYDVANVAAYSWIAFAASSGGKRIEVTAPYPQVRGWTFSCGMT